MNTPPSSAHSTRSPIRQATVGQQAAARPWVARRPRGRARRRRCRRWPSPARARRSPAPASAACWSGQRARSGSSTGHESCRSTPRSPAVSCDRGQGLGRHVEDLEQRRVELGRAELRPRRGRRIGGEPGAEPVAEERVDRAQPQGAGVARPANRLVVLEQPAQLARREVGVERQAAALAHLVRASIGLEPVQHLLGALVLPGDDRGQRATALGVPGEHGLALVVEAAGDDLAGRVAKQLGHRLHDGGQHLLGVLLDPARASAASAPSRAAPPSPAAGRRRRAPP